MEFLREILNASGTATQHHKTHGKHRQLPIQGDTALMPKAKKPQSQKDLAASVSKLGKTKRRLPRQLPAFRTMNEPTLALRSRC